MWKKEKKRVFPVKLLFIFNNMFFTLLSIKVHIDIILVMVRYKL